MEPTPEQIKYLTGFVRELTEKYRTVGLKLFKLLLIRIENLMHWDLRQSLYFKKENHR